MDIGGLEFEIGFWHPFGPHGGETEEEIIARKRDEIKENGWTLWSFQFRSTLKAWYQEIEKAASRDVLVFCSEGKGAKDPAGERKFCNYYIPVNELTRRAIPSAIQIPHPMGIKTKGSAFIVKKIIAPVDYKAAPIEWLKDSQWQTAALPTRPEYLIRSGRGQAMRKFRAMLELQAPYLAEVGIRCT